MKRLLAEFPNKHWPLKTVKRLQWNTWNGQQRINLAVEENEKLFEQKRSIISVISYC